jgi:hypothetical protein
MPFSFASFRSIAFVAALGLICAAGASAQQFDGPGRSWMRKVRIAAYPLTPTNADEIVRQAQASGVYGIEVDNDIPGRYESLLDPAEKLEAIRRVATAPGWSASRRTQTVRIRWRRNILTGCSARSTESRLCLVRSRRSGSTPVKRMCG